MVPTLRSDRFRFFRREGELLWFIGSGAVAALATLAYGAAIQFGVGEACGTALALEILGASGE